VQQQKSAVLPAVVLHGDVTARRPRLEQLRLAKLQVRGADTLTRGPYLGSCWRSSFQSREAV